MSNLRPVGALFSNLAKVASAILCVLQKHEWLGYRRACGTRKSLPTIARESGPGPARAAARLLSEVQLCLGPAHMTTTCCRRLWHVQATNQAAARGAASMDHAGAAATRSRPAAGGQGAADAAASAAAGVRPCTCTSAAAAAAAAAAAPPQHLHLGALTPAAAPPAGRPQVWQECGSRSSSRSGSDAAQACSDTVGPHQQSSSGSGSRSGRRACSQAGALPGASCEAAAADDNLPSWRRGGPHSCR
jgi:hypothetical protein